MTNRELILQELEQTPEPILEEVLDFLRYLKQKNRQTKNIRVISGDQESMVSLEDASRSEALGEMFSSQYFLSPVSQIQRELKEALAASGYKSKEQVVELVQEVKREMWHEQHVNH